MGNKLRVNNVSYNVELHGPENGLPLVLLHGFTGSAGSWREHLSVFAEYDLRVIAFDMLGHGQSDAPQDAQRYGIEQCSIDIRAALQMLGVQAGDAVLLGYSMGGRIALYSAFSGFFRGLILESASAGIEDVWGPTLRRQSDEALAERIERDGVSAFVTYWEQLPLFASQKALPDAIQEEVHAQRLQNSAIGLANSLRGVGTGTQPALYDRLPTLDIPVLVLAGEHDTKFTTIARRMAQVLPQAQVHIVLGAGHTIHLEQAETFDRLVLDFIRSLSIFS